MPKAEKSFDVEKYFSETLNKDKNLSAGIAAIKTLLVLLEKSKFDTVQELHSTIQSAVKVMRTTSHPITAVVSASELFSRFITLAKFDVKTVDECREIMIHRGNTFSRKLQEARTVIAKQCTPFVIDGSTCLNMTAVWAP